MMAAVGSGYVCAYEMNADASEYNATGNNRAIDSGPVRINNVRTLSLSLRSFPESAQLRLDKRSPTMHVMVPTGEPVAMPWHTHRATPMLKKSRDKNSRGVGYLLCKNATAIHVTTGTADLMT